MSASIISLAEKTDTVCPVCWESVHSEKPVGVTTGCGHIWHSACYKEWKRQGEYIYESSTSCSSAQQTQQQQQQQTQTQPQEHRDKNQYSLNSHLNCLICNQPTRSFVDLFIRLPPAVPNHKDLVTQLEHEFHTVSRRTQMSLEKEIARREFEQTWLQEERQLSLAARQRVEQRHGQKIQELERNLGQLKRAFQHQIKTMEERRRQKRHQRRHQQHHHHPHGHYHRRRRSSTSSTTTTSNSNSNSTNTSSTSSSIGNSGSLSDLVMRQSQSLGLLDLLGNSSLQSLSVDSSIYTAEQEQEHDNVTSDDRHDENEGESNQIIVGEQTQQTHDAVEERTAGDLLHADDGLRESHSQSHDSHEDIIDDLDLDSPRVNSASPAMSERDSVTTRTSMPENQTLVVDAMDNRSFPSLVSPIHDTGGLQLQFDVSSEQNQVQFAAVAIANSSDDSISTNTTSSSINSHAAAVTPTATATIFSTRARRASRIIPKDTIFHPTEESSTSSTASHLATSWSSPNNANNTGNNSSSSNNNNNNNVNNMARSRRSVLKDAIFVPTSTSAGESTIAAAAATPITADIAGAEEQKLPASSSLVGSSAVRSLVGSSHQTASDKQCTSRTCGKETDYCTMELLLDNNSNDTKKCLCRKNGQGGCCPAASLSAEYERQRLQAETAYYQHQAELVEWELHQAEIELEQDEMALRQREQRIRMERSRLEASFTSIQRRVEETKQEARDRQKLTAMEEKFIKYKIARCKEEERFEQELEHLKQDEIHIMVRERSEKQRQEAEKIRLKKELNQLVKVMNKLENAKELAKLAEEQSSASQSLETCVVCFEPLVNEESQLGVAVPCGHTFHLACFSGWEKSKRRRGSQVPCPLCNAGTNLCVTIRLNRPGSSLYCSATSSSLAKHFRKEEGRWQRRRLTGLGLAGEASS